jgi:hypothetical protein
MYNIINRVVSIENIELPFFVYIFWQVKAPPMSFVIVVGILKSQERNQYSVQLSN